MRRKPSVTTRPAHELPCERIMEFSSPNGGGLISIMTMDDGTVRVDVYRADATVRVNGRKLPTA